MSLAMRAAARPPVVASTTVHCSRRQTTKAVASFSPPGVPSGLGSKPEQRTATAQQAAASASAPRDVAASGSAQVQSGP